MHDHGLMGHLAQQLSRHLLIHLHFDGFRITRNWVNKGVTNDH